MKTGFGKKKKKKKRDFLYPAQQPTQVTINVAAVRSSGALDLGLILSLCPPGAGAGRPASTSWEKTPPGSNRKRPARGRGCEAAVTHAQWAARVPASRAGGGAGAGGARPTCPPFPALGPWRCPRRAPRQSRALGPRGKFEDGGGDRRRGRGGRGGKGGKASPGGWPEPAAAWTARPPERSPAPGVPVRPPSAAPTSRGSWGSIGALLDGAGGGEGTSFSSGAQEAPGGAARADSPFPDFEVRAAPPLLLPVPSPLGRAGRRGPSRRLLGARWVLPKGIRAPPRRAGRPLVRGGGGSNPGRRRGGRLLGKVGGPWRACLLPPQARDD